jgi:hypothetical protein
MILTFDARQSPNGRIDKRLMMKLKIKYWPDRGIAGYF